MTEQVTSPSPRGTLKKKLSAGQFIVAPGIYEMISAKVADQLGFHALYMTGYVTCPP